MLADAGAGPTLLDACAAPGGKLFHLAELMPTVRLTGLEQRPERLAFMQREAERLGHARIELIAGDATTSSWWSGRPYDAILLDAPCSGSGTLRRHPDIKLLRREEDLRHYVATQRELLENLWQLLAPGGTLLYCTCSLFAEENDEVIAAALAGLPHARLEPLSLPVGMATAHGWQLYPLPAAEIPGPPVDGFYFSLITRSE